MTFGIDGCKFGWIVIGIAKDQSFIVKKYRTFQDFFQEFPNAKKYLIDMPLGLADQNYFRDIEKLAREKLKPNKTSTIFSPPCRAAVFAQTYESAKEINIKLTGKSISIQAWNICQKIREMDEFLIENKSVISKIHEAHPEICFASLNNGKPLISKKKTKEGQQERLALLKQYFPKSMEIFDFYQSNFLKKDVKIDDILDALCLSITGYLGNKIGFSYLKTKPNLDAHKIPMNMIFVDGKKSI